MDPIPRDHEVEPGKAKVAVIYAGGTISSLPNNEEARTGGHEQDLASLLEIHNPAAVDSIEVTSSSFAYSGLSENLTREDQIRIADEVEAALEMGVQSVVMTHGTDTMEHTASYLEERFLERLIQNGQRIIITGANEDTTHPQTDAWDNLSDAFSAAGSDSVLDGVHIAFGGKLIRGAGSVKMPYEPGKPASYDSDDSVEYEEAVERMQARIEHQISLLMQRNEKQIPDSGNVLEYPVNAVTQGHHGLLEFIRENQVNAVVFTLYHSGTANTESPDNSVADLVAHLRDHYGVVCFGATETGEPTDLRKYETSVKLREAGLVPLYDMQAEVAASKLRLLPTMNAQEIIVRMLKNQTGEIDESMINIEDLIALLELYEP